MAISVTGVAADLWSRYEAEATARIGTRAPWPVDEARPVAAAPGSSSFLYDLFRSSPEHKSIDVSQDALLASCAWWADCFKWQTVNGNSDEA